MAASKAMEHGRSNASGYILLPLYSRFIDVVVEAGPEPPRSAIRGWLAICFTPSMARSERSALLRTTGGSPYMRELSSHCQPLSRQAYHLLACFGNGQPRLLILLAHASGCKYSAADGVFFHGGGSMDSFTFNAMPAGATDLAGCTCGVLARV